MGVSRWIFKQPLPATMQQHEDTQRRTPGFTLHRVAPVSYASVTMKKIILIILLASAVVGGFFWYQSQPGPPGEAGPGWPANIVPGFLRSEDPDRLFCAESPETGICRCITAGGHRPAIGDEECRRRARE